MKIVVQNILWLIIFVAYNYLSLAEPSYTIGVLVNEEGGQSEIPVRSVIYGKNLIERRGNYSYVFQKVPKTDSFASSKILCNLTERGIGLAAIFEPVFSESSAIIGSIGAQYEIPYIQTSWKSSTEFISPMSLNFFPEADLYAHALATIVESLHWRSFTIIYENEDALVRMQEILKLQKSEDNPNQNFITLKQLGPGPDHRTLLKDLKNSTESHIILDCDVKEIMNILEQAKTFHLLDIYYSYFLTSLDAHTLDFSSLNAVANITTIRLFDPQNVQFVNAVRNWEQTEYRRHSNMLTLTPEMIKTETALMHDAVLLYTETVNTLLVTQNITSSPVSCKSDVVWSGGYQIVTFMKVIKPSMSLTGPIKFDEDGRRVEFNLHLVETGTKKVIATWYPNDTLYIARSENESEMAQIENLQKITVKVASRLGEPYLRERRSDVVGETYQGNARYEGYAMDLIDEISKILNFTYEFYVVKDYGKKDPITQEWNGLIRELLDRRAHLAICDFTVTYQRKEAVDFSMPFMTLGISILYQKPKAEDVNMFAFLDPFSFNVWIYTATLYLTVSVILFFVSRMAPGDWENPHPCEENPEELENIWDIKNCLWLTLGSIMTQGCDILPKGISSRIATSMWWFFSLIMTSSYTANLAAFLTMQRMEEPIDSAEALSKQTKIKYGTVDGGATQAFFKDSNYTTFSRMWISMHTSKPSVFEKSNADGVRRVSTTRNGLYAFLMESSQIEYEIETKCDLKQVGELLDSKNYGIAMPMNSPYRVAINTAILSLQERGVLTKLKAKWWKEKRSEPSCTGDDQEINSAELALANVGGVFLVLGIGVGVAFILALVEFLWNVRNVSVNEHVSYWEALKVELLFAINIWVTKKRTKPEISESSSSSSSSSNNGERDARSVARSIMHGAGSFLNLNAINRLGSTLHLDRD